MIGNTLWFIRKVEYDAFQEKIIWSVYLHGKITHDEFLDQNVVHT